MVIIQWAACRGGTSSNLIIISLMTVFDFGSCQFVPSAEGELHAHHQLWKQEVTASSLLLLLCLQHRMTIMNLLALHQTKEMRRQPSSILSNPSWPNYVRWSLSSCQASSNCRHWIGTLSPLTMNNLSAFLPHDPLKVETLRTLQ